MNKKTATLSGAQRQGLLVVGMHRSGTSALTGTLEILGSTSPATQIAGGAQNPRGFFESKPIARLNDSLLAVFEKTWDNWSPGTSTPSRVNKCNEHAEQADGILEHEFGDAALISIKDPRICHLLPFWFQALERLDIEPLVIFPIRHPEEVAQSLRIRNGFGREHGLLLWLSHVLSAEKSSRGKRRSFTHFSDLLDNPVKVATRLSETLGVRFPKDPKSCRAEFDGFLSEELRHFHAREEAVPRELYRIYHIFKRWSAGGEDPKDYALLDKVYDQFVALGKTDLFEFVQGDKARNDASAKCLFEIMFYANGFLNGNLEFPFKAKKLTKAQSNSFLESAIVACGERRRKTDKKLRMSRMDQAAEMGNLARLMVDADDARIAISRDNAALAKKAEDLSDQMSKLSKENHELSLQMRACESVDALHALVARVENDRNALEVQNNELHALVARVENDRVALEVQNNELHALVARVENERRMISESTMWRATAPARKILSAFRKTGAPTDSAAPPSLPDKTGKDD